MSPDHKRISGEWFVITIKYKNGSYGYLGASNLDMSGNSCKVMEHPYSPDVLAFSETSSAYAHWEKVKQTFPSEPWQRFLSKVESVFLLEISTDPLFSHRLDLTR